MAEHKAATEVTIAPLADKSFVEELVSRYWLPALGAALALTAWVLYRSYTSSRGQEVRAESWSALFDAGGTPEDFAAFASAHPGDPAEPFAEFLRASTLASEQKLEEAAQALQGLRGEFPEHPLVAQVWAFDEEDSPRSAVERLANSIDEQLRWKSDHPGLFANPEPPAEAPKVRIATSEGDVVLALYEEQAPEHAANFLSLCENGGYDGTAFDKVLPGILIEGGEAPEAEAVAFEENGLRHFEGAVGSVRAPGESDSDGARFVIAVGAAHHLDRQNVVFGAVVEGLEIARAISEGATEEGSPDRPAEPVVITSTSIH